MKFIEFKNKAEALGYTVTINKDEQDKRDEQYNRVYVYLENDKTSIMIAKIFEFKDEVWWFAKDAIAGRDIETLIDTFNDTPIDERDYNDIELNDMDKAKVVIADDSIRTVDLEAKTGIGRASIINYRSGKTDIERAKWEVVNKLARYYDEQHS